MLDVNIGLFILSGLPDFNIQKLDPMFYKDHHAIYDTGEVHADIQAINTTVTGLAGSRFLSAKAHFADDTLRLEVDSHVPKIILDGIGKGVGGFGPFRLNHTGTKNYL